MDSALDRLSDAQLRSYMAQAKSPETCALLELGGLFFGLGGLGLMLGGRAGLGVAALLAYWGLLGGCVLLAMSGVAVLLLVPVVPVWWVLTVVSAAQVARQHNEQLARQLLAAEGVADSVPIARSRAVRLGGALAMAAVVVLGVAALVAIGVALLFLQ